MANDFKRFCVPNVGTSNTDLYTVPAGAGSSALETIVIGDRKSACRERV